MTPTRPRTLLLLAVVAVSLGWGVTFVVDRVVGRFFPVPWSVPVVMAVLALAVAAWARGTKARLGHKPGTKPMPPLVAARTAALALATSRAGSVVGGFYTGVALGLAAYWSSNAEARIIVVAALLTALASLGLVLAGLWLERVCRIPPSDGAADAASDGDVL
jgi:hypothetical protein